MDNFEKDESLWCMLKWYIYCRLVLINTVCYSVSFEILTCCGLGVVIY